MHREPAGPKMYGLLAEFADPNELTEAARRTYAEGYRKTDAYSPFPIEPVWEALGDAHDRAGSYAEAARAYRTAYKLLDDDPVREAELLLKQAWIPERDGRYPQAIRAYFLASPLLRSDLRVLDAGCGTGVVTLGLREALLRRGLRPGILHAFDLTPAMLEHFRRTLRERTLEGVELARADVLQPSMLPAGWSDYDLVVSASMLEYLPRERLSALGGVVSRVEQDVAERVAHLER